MDRFPTISKIQQQLKQQQPNDILTHQHQQNSYQQQLEEQLGGHQIPNSKDKLDNDIFCSSIQEADSHKSHPSQHSLSHISQLGADQSTQMKRVPLKDSSKFFINASNTPVNSMSGPANIIQKRSLLDQRADSISKQSHPFLVQQQPQPQQVIGNGSQMIKREKAKPQQNRMTGEELKTWQQSWRKIMKVSVVYFENDEGKNEKDKLRAKLALESLGASFERFFSENVTIIISKRFYDRNLEYPKGDIFRVAKRNYLKVWTYEKVFKFMNDLGETVPDYEEQLANRARLSSLLKNEKLFGPNDRDPNAKRDDIKYFTGYFYYIYDLRQQTRPVAIREWGMKGGDTFPRLYKSTNGRSLFLEDQGSGNNEKRHKRRLAYLEETKEYRRKLIESSPHPIYGVFPYEQRVQFKEIYESEIAGVPSSKRQKLSFSYNFTNRILTHQFNNENSSGSRLTDITNTVNNVHNDDDTDYVVSIKNPSMAAPAAQHSHPALLRNDSVLGTNQSQNKFNNEFGEIEASGVVQQSNSAVFGGSNTNNANQLGNGLGATTSTVFSKKISNDKRKMITLTPIPIPKPTAGFFGGAPQSPTLLRESQTRNRDSMKIIQIRREDKIVKVLDIKRDSKFITSEEAAAAAAIRLSSTTGEQNDGDHSENCDNDMINIDNDNDEVKKFTTPTKKLKQRKLKKAALLKRESLDDIEIPILRQKKARNQMKPGYCENCRVKYDDFDDHIVSDKHRHFALDSENFYDIDNLIDDVNVTRMMSL